MKSTSVLERLEDHFFLENFRAVLGCKTEQARAMLDTAVEIGVVKAYDAYLCPECQVVLRTFERGQKPATSRLECHCCPEDRDLIPVERCKVLELYAKIER